MSIEFGEPEDVPDSTPSNLSNNQSSDNFARYRRALEQEFELNKDGDIAKKAEQSLLESLPTAVSTLTSLMQHGESERIRFNAAVYVIDRNLGPVNKLGVRDDSIEITLKELNSKAR